MVDHAGTEDPWDAGALSLYATLLMKEGRADEARQVIEERKAQGGVGTVFCLSWGG